jgi:large subunit ribosomal protein L10
MAKKEKKTIVDDLAGVLSASQSVVLADFTGLKVDDMNQLRRDLKGRSVKFRVVKNTLARIAVRQAELEGLLAYLQGPTAFVTSSKDPIEPARALAEFAQEKEKPKIKGILFEGEVGGPSLAERVRGLPTRNVLLGRLLSTIGSPIAGLTGTLQGIIRDLVGTLVAIQSLKEDKNG